MKKIVLSGLWTETCVALPTVQAIYDKYEVYVAEDTIRSAVDLRVPMVAVTLLHRKVIFTRRSMPGGGKQRSLQDGLSKTF
jgi:nicotinamidase-related amidase